MLRGEQVPCRPEGKRGSTVALQGTRIVGMPPADAVGEPRGGGPELFTIARSFFG